MLKDVGVAYYASQIQRIVSAFVIQGDICLGLLQEFPQVLVACIKVGKGFFLRKVSP